SSACATALVSRIAAGPTSTAAMRCQLLRRKDMLNSFASFLTELPLRPAARTQGVGGQPAALAQLLDEHAHVRVGVVLVVHEGGAGPQRVAPHRQAAARAYQLRPQQPRQLFV